MAGTVCMVTVVVADVAIPTPFNLGDLPSPRDLQAIDVDSGAATILLHYVWVSQAI
jgi:hypothetical protein